jgi:hypothetical protein
MPCFGQCGHGENDKGERMKYRKKPVVIDAVQYIPGETDHIPGIELDHNLKPIIPTLEGPLHVSPYDWIITGVKGEKYPCKPDIFAELYEKVEENQ